METELLKARIKDTAEIAVKASKPKFLGFLTEDEAVLTQSLLVNSGCRFKLYGGYDGARRVFLGCFPEWADTENFPISAVSFNFRREYELRHRDFLGALMSLGISRESIGDILAEEGRAVVFIADDIKKYVVTQINKIGSVGVTVTEGYEEPLPKCDTLAEFSVTAASDRLDCILSALCGLPRSKAVGCISEGFVTVNSVCAEKTTKTVKENDVISVRGKGKFIISDLNGRTKKDRIIVNYKKYI